MIAEWALVILTGALVGVTIFYAIQTYKLAKAPFRPVLVASLGLSSGGSVTRTVIVIENIGVGPALMIVGKYSINKSDKKEIDIRILRPEESSRIVQDDLPHLENRDHYDNKTTQIKIELNYQNGLGDKYTYGTSLDVSDQSSKYKNPFT